MCTLYLNVGHIEKLYKYLNVSHIGSKRLVWTWKSNESISLIPRELPNGKSGHAPYTLTFITQL